MKRFFITGIAGFIGYHLASFLKKRGDFVTGCDNFNSYYDPRLKRERFRRLTEMGINVLESDIQNVELLQQVLKKEKITHFVHLAAQAGVRHSIENPESYVTNNLDAFVQILELLRRHNKIKLTYASSSSVYGLNSKVPFCEEDRTDQPANLYGATKKSNELLAFAYHHLYGISVTGLRYFTVYGPLGRPDMAYFLFTRALLEGSPIQLFNEGKMERDFTYIDDIVQGTASAIDLESPCEIFNLGNSHPENILTLLELIEQKTGKKAHKKFLPMQPGEVLSTYADISKSKKLLGFSPKISLEEGISCFVDWYLTAYK